MPLLIICRWKYHDEKLCGVGVQGAAAQVTEGSRCAGARDDPARATRRACVLGRRAFLRLNPRPVGCKAVVCGSGCTRAACALVACVFCSTQAPYRGHSHRPSDQPRRKLRARPPNHPFGFFAREILRAPVHCDPYVLHQVVWWFGGIKRMSPGISWGVS